MLGLLFFFFFFFFFNDTATTEIYTLSLHDALPTWASWASSETVGSRPYRAWWLRAAARARTRGAGLPAEPGAWLGCTTGCSTGWTGLSNGREEIGCGSAAPSDAFMLDACCTGGLDGLDALSNCVLSRLDGGVGRVAAGCSTVGHAGLDGGSGAAGLTRRCQPGRGSVRGGEQVDQVGDDRGGDRGPGADSEPEQG